MDLSPSFSLVLGKWVTASSDGQTPPLEEHFGAWIRAASGCRFAAKLMASHIRLFFSGGVDLARVRHSNESISAAAESDCAVVAVFPQVESEDGIVGLLHTLAQNERWMVAVEDVPRPGVFVSVRWKTDDGNLSSTMGLAPLLTMPLTRRAPCVALALWGGRQKYSKDGRVGFIDMPSPLAGDEHKHELRATTNRVMGLIGEDPADAPWREVAFRLPEVHRDQLLALLAGEGGPAGTR